MDDTQFNDTFCNRVLSATICGFYLWRCGASVSADHQGNTFQQNACHKRDGFDGTTLLNLKKEDAQVPVQPMRQWRDGTGGWHDAGDYGKYTSNASFTVGLLLFTWDAFKEKLVKYRHPHSKPRPRQCLGTNSLLPDILAEVKWETDWLLKMQYPDGSGRISHKLTSLHHAGQVMPDNDRSERFFSPWSSAATANFVAAMAMMARLVRPYDHGYAVKCLKAARNSYSYLAAHPSEERWVQGPFTTGGYSVAAEKDLGLNTSCQLDLHNRMWAAAEMWRTTGERQFENDFFLLFGKDIPVRPKQRPIGHRNYIDHEWDWCNLGNMASFSILLSPLVDQKTPFFRQLRADLLQTAGKIVEEVNSDEFGRPLADYRWGSNGTVARQCMTLFVANQLQEEPIWQAIAQKIVWNLLGKNQYGRSYVTGFGVNPPLFIHDRRSQADRVYNPWPGYLIGGGTSPSNWQDKWTSYETNEIAINWQASLVFALSWVASGPSQFGSDTRRSAVCLENMHI